MEEQPALNQRWTRELLESCTPKELLVICAQYGVLEVSRRMGYASIERFFFKDKQA